METKYVDEFKLLLELIDLDVVILNNLKKAAKENNEIRMNLLLDFSKMVLQDINETIKNI